MNIQIMYQHAKAWRWLGRIIQSWKLLAFITFLMSPTGPHIRWADPWKAYHSSPCAYLGSRGFVEIREHFNCPFLVILNANQQRKI